MDKTLIRSGHKQLYYKDANDQATAYMHKLSFYANDSDALAFGDRNLTAVGSDIYADISNCVRNYVKDLSIKIHSLHLSIADAVEQLLLERINLCDFSDSSNVKWYIVKYKEFFYSKTSTTLSVLRRKNYGGIDDDNVYDMQCLNDDNNFNYNHYHPFYMALSNQLTNHITISSPLQYTGVHIEYAHPCILSNGWIIKINKDGNWIIDFGENMPTSPMANLTVDTAGTGVLDCSGYDSISKITDFLNAL